MAVCTISAINLCYVIVVNVNVCAIAVHVHMLLISIVDGIIHMADIVVIYTLVFVLLY